MLILVDRRRTFYFSRCECSFIRLIRGKKKATDVKTGAKTDELKRGSVNFYSSWV